MQLRTLVLMTTLAVVVTFASTANAAECTNAELLQLDALHDDPALDTACPDKVGDTDIFEFDTIDAKDWAKPSPCKDATCLTLLKAHGAKVPNCDIGTVNMKTVYESKLTLCVDIAGGALTPAESAARVANLTSLPTFETLVDKAKLAPAANVSGSTTPTNGTTPTAPGTTTTTAPVTSTTTAPPKKSGVAAVALTSGSVLVAATLATLATVMAE